MQPKAIFQNSNKKTENNVAGADLNVNNITINDFSKVLMNNDIKNNSLAF